MPSTPERIVIKLENHKESLIYGWEEAYLSVLHFLEKKNFIILNQNISKKIEIIRKKADISIFKKRLKRWNCHHDFLSLIKLAATRHDYVEARGKKLIAEDNANPKGFALVQACLEHKPKEGHYDVGFSAQQTVIHLIYHRGLEATRHFCVSLQKIFPQNIEPFALLYDLIYLKQRKYRAVKNPINRKRKKRLLFSYSLWGDRYIQLFNDYCIPCLMAPGNIPAVAEIRDIAFDIYAHREDILEIEKQPLFKQLAKLCEVNFIEFPKRLVTCEGYTRNNAEFRYYIYGGFHHLSIERARAMGADVICLGPDNIYSDGSFLNYVRMVDAGYQAVLFTATRAQAEFLGPVLDRMKDPSGGALSLTSEDLVDFSARYIHHTFLQYVVTDDKTPEWRSGIFIPYKNGFTIRSFHYHPVIIAAEVLSGAKDIEWNYSPLDSNMVSKLFPGKKDWERVKVITDSKEGIMLDLAYGNPGAAPPDRIAFSEEFLDKLYNAFDENHHWNFQFTVDYRTNKDLSGVRSFAYDNRVLQPVEFPLNKTMEDIRARLDSWYDAKVSGNPRTKQRRAITETSRAAF